MSPFVGGIGLAAALGCYKSFTKQFDVVSALAVNLSGGLV